MHYRVEIVMPPTENVEEAITQILAPFDENNRRKKDAGKEKFWDWWQIGGRYAGRKFEEGFDEKKIDDFYEWMKEEHITVSSFQAGKQTLSPPSQIEKVDKKWNEMFPSKKFVPCPLFDHATHKNMPCDIMRLGDMPKRTSASRVIIATPSWIYNKKTEKGSFIGSLEAKEMISDSFYNGVSFVDSKWDGKVATVLEKYISKYPKASDEWRASQLPTDDWLVVTVDCHD